MSKSKRTNLGDIPSEIRQEKKLFTGASGEIRTGWLLAASLSAYALVAVAVRYGLVRAFDALFRAWGIDATTAALAPGWARALYVWHGSIATLAFGALTLGLCRWLGRLWRIRTVQKSKNRLKSALLGACAGLVVAALCLLPDSSRPEWPLSAPRLSLQMPLLCGISLVAVWAEEAFTKGILLEGLLPRWGRPWAEIVAVAAFFLISGGIGGSWVSALNVALLGALSCLLCERNGLWSAVLFRWGWSAVNAFLLGFGGGDASAYRLYGVSEVLMTGGDAGPAWGLWTALLFAGGIVWMALGKKKQTA